MTTSTGARKRSVRRLALLGETDVSAIAGIGAKGAKALSEIGVSSVLDLITYYPRRFADRTNCVDVVDLVPGAQATVRATVRRVDLRRPRGGKPIVQLIVGDDDATLAVTFFNQPWRARQLDVGMDVVLYGKADVYRSRLSMTNPLLDIVGGRDEFRETGRIVPIYPQSGKAGIASYQIARWIERALSFADEHDAFVDPISKDRLDALELVSRRDAFYGIHHPASLADKDAARRRLAFDELWRLQVVLVMRKRAALESARGIAHAVDDPDRHDLVSEFVAALPFPLTGAQQRAISEIAADLKRPYPMHRLLQGDVGAGKTVVALASLLYGVQGGYQGALMVPTEVLAEQHFLAARSMLSGLEVDDPTRLSGRRPVTAALLTAKTPAGERARLVDELQSGAVDVLVGTHALLTDDVHFGALGVVVIDEQHRFGVDQRASLREKGSSSGAYDPDLLVMTATPIPRTAAMTVYGDLDMSTLDELPIGRSPIKTTWVPDEEQLGAVWDKVRHEVESGQAAYVVCPLVRLGEREEGDDDVAVDTDEDREDGRLFASSAKKTGQDDLAKRSLHAVTEEYERLVDGDLAGLRVGLLHGQLPARTKETVMESFRSGEIDVLVATTVIEVGVDVERATVMVIEDADRFGIAQLHQLRGRVGRGAKQSFCYLIAPLASTSAQVRLEALEQSTDGFALAEIDLELRGEGAVFGARQKGRSDLRLASLRRDRDLVERARQVAEIALEKDPKLARHPAFAEELRAFIDDEEAAYLLRS